jgi:SAM-dependent methyltransferase
VWSAEPSSRVVLPAVAPAVPGTLGVSTRTAEYALERLLGELGITDAGHWWRSTLDPSRRYWAGGDRFVKVTERHRGGSTARRRDLGGEFAILQRVRGVRGIPEVHRWIDGDCWQLLIMERMDGLPLDRVELSAARLGLVMLRLMAVVWRLAWHGVSHDDLRPGNVMVDTRGRVAVVDFDQAVEAPFLVAIGRCFLGLGLGRGRVPNTVWAALRKRLQVALAARARRWLDALKRRPARPLPALPDDAGPELRALHEAWQIAMAADASAPHRPLAYHDLIYEGFHLPGERPWRARWRVLSGITAYQDRRILELGCNLALLSTFLLEEAGVRAALAVDRDRAILCAARKVAVAFGVEPQFRHIDFDADHGWEDQLQSFEPDLVFALSLYHWVRNKDRLLRFFGRFEQLIYEGHDGAPVERARLQRAGFVAIDLVATSERGRPVFHCRK